ncbi:MAG: hypothetical protein LBB94_01130, partial [Clostridiales bacterium]|nr:hypothetical protein [Clostridiales bacterium]
MKNNYRQSGFEFAYSGLAQAGYTLAAFAKLLNLSRIALYGINNIARLVYNDFQSNGIEVIKLYTHDNADYLLDRRRTEQFAHIRDADYLEFDAVINCANSLDIHIKAAGRTRVINARKLLQFAEVYTLRIIPIFQKFAELNMRGVRTFWFSPPCVDQIENPSDREIELWEYNISSKISWERARANKKPWAE